MFDSRIEAWINGPVVPEIYQNHKGQFEIKEWPLGNPEALTQEQRETVTGVMGFYGNKTGQWLSDLTHREKPWLDARAGLASDERGESEITPAALHEFYSGL